MDWAPYLGRDESVRWEGRPAPRCYTFRNWRHALFGIILLLPSGYWQFMSFGIALEYGLPWMPLLPLPFVFCALYLSFGQLFIARLEWEKVFFAVTDRRVIAVGGLLRPKTRSLTLDDLSYFQIKFLSENLGSIHLHAAGIERTIVLPCLEHPQTIIPFLESAVTSKPELA